MIRLSFVYVVHSHIVTRFYYWVYRVLFFAWLKPYGPGILVRRNRETK